MPQIIDNALQAWGTLLNTTAFSVRVPQSQVENLEVMLGAWNLPPLWLRSKKSGSLALVCLGRRPKPALSPS